MASGETLVFDATTIIYLTKAGVIKRPGVMGRPLLVPAEVYEKVVLKGKEVGAPDAFEFERLVTEGVFDITEPSAGEELAKVREATRGSDAETAVLLEAMRVEGTVVSDDLRVRRLASLGKTEVTGGTGILITLVNLGKMSNEEGREALNVMVESGWWCDTRTYSKILRRLGF